MGVRHIDKDLPGIMIDLEAFGVRLHFDVANLAAGRGIDHSQRAAAIADENPIGCGIDANIVCVAAKLNLARGFVFASFKQSHRTVAGVGDIKRVCGRFVADPLRLFQPRDRSEQFAVGEVDNADGIVA